MAGDISRSSELAATRRERLKQLSKELGGYTSAARVLGISRGTLSRLVHTRQKFSRPIADEEARGFEKIARKPSGWLDGTGMPGQDDVIEVRTDHISLSIEEDVPPRAHGVRMKDYAELLFVEAWSQRLRANAIRHRGLNAIINVSVWRSGWLSMLAKGHFTCERAATIVERLRAMSDAVRNYSKNAAIDDVVIFPSDTVVVGDALPNATSYLIDPQPAPAASIHTRVAQRQLSKADSFGDMVAVFQVTLWGDETLRSAFSGFPLRADVADVIAKLDQLSGIIAANLAVHQARQAG